MELSNRQKNQAIYLRELTQASGWKVYEEFIKDEIFNKLGNEMINKDVLIGMKLAIDSAKTLIKAYEEDRINKT